MEKCVKASLPVSIGFRLGGEHAGLQWICDIKL